jgi:hypothetical protein
MIGLGIIKKKYYHGEIMEKRLYIKFTQNNGNKTTKVFPPCILRCSVCSMVIKTDFIYACLGSDVFKFLMQPFR